MTTNPNEVSLLPCPFCGWQPPIDDLRDVLYPSGIYRRTGVDFHHYVSMNQSQKGDEPCWQIGCTENMGGCGALVNADSLDEAIAKWNTRTSATSDAADTARYRWLRNESWAGYHQSKHHPQVAQSIVFVSDGAGNVKTILAEEALDQAIDAAIAAGCGQ